MLKLYQFKKNHHPNRITIDDFNGKNINKIPTNLKKIHRKYGNCVHVKTQPNYRNLETNILCYLKRIILITPQTVLVYVSTSSYRNITLMFSGNVFKYEGPFF